MESIFTMTATQLARLIRERQLGVEELTRAYLERIERWGGPDALNAMAAVDATAIEQARRMDGAKTGRDGALFGLPILVKDNIDVAALPTTAGSVALADNRADRDAPVVANLRRSGALILGKTCLTEFANYTSKGMPNGFSALGGQVKNAYDRAKDPGGSSTGSAVAVSAGLCAAALGTDTSFSIVGCATDNGVTGLKPAHGSLSSEGIVPLAHTMDSAGPLTRDLTDALLVYACMRDTPLPPIAPVKPGTLRLAVNVYQRDQVSGAQLARYEAWLTSLRRMGVQTFDVSHARTSLQGVVMRHEFARDLEAYLSGSAARFRTLREIVAHYEADPERRMPYGISCLRAALESAGDPAEEAAYRAALSERERLRAEVLEELQAADACLMTGPSNLMHFIGLPSVALRLGMGADGTPRGAILYGADERRLFAAALTLETACEPVAPPML